MTTNKPSQARKNLIIAIILCAAIGGCTMKKFGLPPYYETKESAASLSTDADVKIQTLTIENKTITAVQSGNPQKPLIVFVHGSPGKWDAWADYLHDETLKAGASMIALDRLGFGGSDNGSHEESLETHAKFVMETVNKLAPNAEDITVVGHSYGGPVALRMAVDYPDKIANLVLLAPSISPEYEKVRWYNTLADFPPIRAILPSGVKHSNQEILPLKGELEKMQPLLKDVTASVTVIQGINDKLVPYQNAEFAQEALTNADVKIDLIKNQGHFIPWEQYDLVKKTLLELLGET